MEIHFVSFERGEAPENLIHSWAFSALQSMEGKSAFNMERTGGFCILGL